MLFIFKKVINETYSLAFAIYILIRLIAIFSENDYIE